jgi:hypothetical protein
MSRNRFQLERPLAATVETSSLGAVATPHLCNEEISG